MGFNLISLYLYHRVQVNAVMWECICIVPSSTQTKSNTCEYVTTGSLFNLTQINQLPVNNAQIQAENSSYIILSKVLDYTRELIIYNIRESQSLF